MSRTNTNSNTNNNVSQVQYARAVQFIYIDQEGQFQISKEAIKIFEGSHNKIAVICITGCYRTGKSFLMNQLVGEQSAFQVDPTVNACTRGLWFYSEPITIEKDNEIFDIYIMDSEGLGGVDKNQNYDVKIFTLSVLLSSFLIYNQVGVIDEQAINNISLVTNLAKNIQIQKNSSSVQGNDNLSQYFPQFLWLLRDFVLELADEEGNPITPNEYLDQCLKEQEGFSQKIAEKNRIRNIIKSFFKQRYCFTLIRPTDDERDIQNLSKQMHKVKEDFLEQIEELKIFIFNRIKTVKLNGVSLRSQDYLILANSYIQSINKGGIPTINDAWTDVVENQLKNASTKALRHYQKELKSFVLQYSPVDLESLSKQHKTLKDSATEILEKVINVQQGVSDSSKEKFRNQLALNIKETYEQVKNKVKQEYERQSKDVLAELYREKILPKQYADLPTLYKDWSDLEKAYFAKVPGKAKYELWSKFALEKIMDGSMRIVKSGDSKKDLQLKQMELEIGRLNTIIEMKGESQAKFSSSNEKMMGDISKKLVSAQERENELKMNILAYQDLVQRKDDEIQSLQEQLGRMRNASFYGGQQQHRGQPMLMQGQNDNGIMPPMCGTKDCRIF